MIESGRSEIIREKIISFISNPKTQPEYMKLYTIIDNKFKRNLGSYYDQERHSTMQLVLDCFDNIIEGKRHWDYDKVRFEAMFFNTARSLIGNEVSKEKKYREMIGIHSVNHRTTDEYGNETEEEIFDYCNCDSNAYNSDINRLFDEEIIKMVQSKLKKDKTALLVMEELKHSGSNSFIAKQLGIEIKEVENVRKRILRAGEKVLNVLCKTDNMSKEEIRRQILRRE